MSKIVWQCTGCGKDLNGNPRMCPYCGYTVYRPTYPEKQAVTTPNTKQEHPLSKLGWKWYDELNGWRKRSNHTIPMFSPGGEGSWDELSDGNARELEQLITDTVKAEVNKALDKVRNQSITVLPETYPTGQRTSIDAVPVSAIEQVRKEINDE